MALSRLVMMAFLPGLVRTKRMAASTLGSMLPKVEAAMRFVRTNPGKKAIITSLDKAIDALDGKTGTVITFA